MAQSNLNITRNFDPTVSFLREGTRLTYTFSATSQVSGVAGLPVNMTFFRDKQIKSLATNVVSSNITNIVGMSNNMTSSFDPTLGVTVTGLAGAPITFFPEQLVLTLTWF